MIKHPSCVNTEWIPAQPVPVSRAQSIFRYCADTKLRAVQPRLYIIIVNNGYGQLNDRMHVGTRCIRQTQTWWVSMYRIECAVNPLTYIHTGDVLLLLYVERIIQNNSRCSVYNSSRIIDKLNNRMKNAIPREGLINEIKYRLLIYFGILHCENFSNITWENLSVLAWFTLDGNSE